MSKFQTVEVVKTKPFGRLLITDGPMQSSEDDGGVYHQSLVHPALAGHPEPKKVLHSRAAERCVSHTSTRANASHDPSGIERLPRACTPS